MTKIIGVDINPSKFTKGRPYIRQYNNVTYSFEVRLVWFGESLSINTRKPAKGILLLFAKLMLIIVISQCKPRPSNGSYRFP